MIRKPAVAGQFYPGSKKHLEEEVKKYLSRGGEPGFSQAKKVIGIIAPHAGYIYSGGVAGAVFSSAKIPERVIVLSPNHTGLGAPAAIMPEGEWETPLGRIEIDSKLASVLMQNCPELKADTAAHAHEHSLEVQLPFLQILNPNLKFVPITVSHLRYDVCEKIGKAIAKTITQFGRLKSASPKFGEPDLSPAILIIASSDMTHYEPADIAKKKDSLAIERVLHLDAKGLLDTCAHERITMCGVIPATIMLIAAKELGAVKGELIKYANSGDVSGDYSSVVGYAGMVVY